MSPVPQFLRPWRLSMVFTAMFVCALNTAAIPALAGVEEATLAFSSGKFDTAMRGFRELATGGDSEAEFMLGVMYYQGYGVKQNRAFAAVWFHKAALKGHSGAQLAFGSIHIRGVGVYQNLNQAYKWLALAAGSGSSDIREKAGNLLQDARRLMTAAEVQEATKEVMDFQPVTSGLIRH